MTALPLAIAAKATILLAGAAIVDALLRRHGSAAARHLVWTIAIAALLVLPIATLALPAWTVRIPLATADSSAAVAVPVVAVPNPTSTTVGEPGCAAAGLKACATYDSPAHVRTASWSLMVIAIYPVGVLLLLARLAIEPFALRRIVRGSQEVADGAWIERLERATRAMGVGRRVRLLRSPRDIMPLTFGTAAPTIVLPASSDAWTDDRRDAVLLHELAHVARRDCFVQRMTALASALYWPHPGVWWAARRLRAERELACDDRVLALGAGAREYAGHLLDLAHSLGAAPAPATALGMARPRLLETRLLAVLDAARNRAALEPRRRTLAVAIAVAVVVPLAAAHAALVARDAPGVAGASPLDLQAQGRAAAPSELTGTWELRLSRDPGMAQVTVHTEHGNHGRSVRLEQLPGLSIDRISAASANISVPIRREAGTFNVDGTCRRGVCGGTFAFEPSQAFASELARRGFGRPTPQQQMDLALADVGISYLQALDKAGYAKPNLEDVVRAAQHGVDAGYLNEMTTLGYRAGTLDALTRLRDHGVDPTYVKGMRDAGYRIDSADELTRLRDHGIDPTYVRGMADSGFAHLSLKELLDARDHGVDPQYMKSMRDLGYRLDDIASFIRTRDHGIDPSYVREMAALGYKGQSLDALIKSRDHGVDPHYVKELGELGYKNLALEDAIRMRDHGVDAAYVRRVQQKGLGHLSVDELIYRRDRGMDDPDAAAREIAAQARSLWQSVRRWLRS